MSSPIQHLRTFNPAALVAVHFAREHHELFARIGQIKLRLAELNDNLIPTARDARFSTWLRELHYERLWLEDELAKLMPSSRDELGAARAS